MGGFVLKLPVCWSCQYNFKWRELLFVVEGRKECPNCKAKQFTTTHSKWKVGVIFVPMMLIIPFLRILFNPSYSFQMFLIIVLGLICYSFVPYQYKFTDKHQPLF